VGIHYAICSAVEEPPLSRVYCYDVEPEKPRVLEHEDRRVALGSARVTSRVTGESMRMAYAVAHSGAHRLRAGVLPLDEGQDPPFDRKTVDAVRRALKRGDEDAVVAVLERRLDAFDATLGSLFHDEQERLLGSLLSVTVDEVETEFERIYDDCAPLMNELRDRGITMPRALQTSAEVALNGELRRVLTAPELDVERAAALLHELENRDVEPDERVIGVTLQHRIERLALRFASAPGDLPTLERLVAAVEFADSLPFEVDLWKVQNVCWETSREGYREQRKLADEGDEHAKTWTERFTELATRVSVRVA
jgi:hypothetical protein